MTKDELQSCPVIALVNYSVNVDEEGEVGHYDGILGLEEELESFMGMRNADAGALELLAGRLQELYQEYLGEGRKRYVHMCKEVIGDEKRQQKSKNSSPAKRAPKRKPGRPDGGTRKSPRGKASEDRI